MEVRGLILAALFSSLVVNCYGEVLFSSLQNTIVITTSPAKVDLMAGEGQVKLNWGLNKSISKVDTSSYKTMKVKLCYLPESQKDRPWRKTNDNLFKDRTCQHTVTSMPFSTANTSFDYKVKNDVPTGKYFVRVYVLNSEGKETAYGQTTNTELSVTAISGRSKSLDVMSGVFSAFSVVSLAFFFYWEKKKARQASK